MSTPNIEDYERALQAIASTPSHEGLLAVLLIRDGVRDVLTKSESRPAETVQQVLDLDHRLRDVLMQSKDTRLLPDYRKTLAPSDEQWWWYVDRDVTAQEEKKDLIWKVGAVLLFTMTGALALEIIKRLWTGTPDTTAFLGTLLTLVLTSSAFTVQGRELGQWFLEHVPRLKRQSHAEAKFAMAVIAALLVLGIWWVGIPQLARYYNNKGRNLADSNLMQANRYLQRAAALIHDAPVPCYNIGRNYENAGLLDDAATWYQQALERDLNFFPAYNEQGRILILQKKYEAAIRLLLAGLRRINDNTQLANETRYRLLQNIGWAYYAHEKYELAQEALETAIALEHDAMHPVAINSPAHYFLALVLEARGMSKLACEHWDITQRYPDQEFLYQEGWERIIEQRNQQCNQGEKP